MNLTVADENTHSDVDFVFFFHILSPIIVLFSFIVSTNEEVYYEEA